MFLSACRSFILPVCSLTRLGSVGDEQIWRLVCKNLRVFCDITVLKSQQTKALLVIKNVKRFPSRLKKERIIMELAIFFIIPTLRDNRCKITQKYRVNVFSEEKLMFTLTPTFVAISLFWTKLIYILRVSRPENQVPFKETVLFMSSAVLSKTNKDKGQLVNCLL